MINRKEDTVMLVLQSGTTAVPRLPASIKLQSPSKAKACK